MPAGVRIRTGMSSPATETAAVIDQNEAGTNSIDSPVDVKYLTLVGSAEPEPEPAPAADTVTVELLTLRRGENRGNAQIGTVQTILKAAGLYTMDVDNSYGPGTETAVKKFQAAKGLDADGVVGIEHPGRRCSAADNK